MLLDDKEEEAVLLREWLDVATVVVEEVDVLERLALMLLVVQTVLDIELEIAVLSVRLHEELMLTLLLSLWLPV